MAMVLDNLPSIFYFDLPKVDLHIDKIVVWLLYNAVVG